MNLISLPYSFNFELFCQIVLAVFAAGCFIQLLYSIGFFLRLAFFKPKSEQMQQKPVSVIICARNEMKNLRQNLESILNQNYPSYQVIVVNDCSWDDTGLYLEVMEQHYHHLKVVTIKEQERYQHGKKFALSIGIKAAQYDYLLLTDADCIPASDNWIAEMMQVYDSQTEIVLGYGAYEKMSGLLNKWIRFDTAYSAMQYLSFALCKLPYMGVGRNLSYTKELFFKRKGFASHQHILSGDDDLFVNEHANNNNVAVCLNPNSFTISKPKLNWSDWFNQKKRHISTSVHYRGSHKFLLGLFHTSQYLFFIPAIILLATQWQWMLVTSLILFRYVVTYFVWNRCFNKLGERDLIWVSPILEMGMLFIYPCVGIASRFHRNQTWK
jgi:biofilm PGA synthesis N-glycosyltransferase PgaC